MEKVKKDNPMLLLRARLGLTCSQMAKIPIIPFIPCGICWETKAVRRSLSGKYVRYITSMSAGFGERSVWTRQLKAGFRRQGSSIMPLWGSA